MLPGSREFRPGLWPSVATALLLPLLIGLGFWQLDRAEQKRDLEQAYRDRQQAPALDLASAGEQASERETMLWRRVRLHGEYLRKEQFLLDNQIVGGDAGYLVYSPFRAHDLDAIVLVNRGWVPMGGDRNTTPEVSSPGGDVIEGTVKGPQSTGLLLAETIAEELGQGLVRVQQIDLDAIARRNDWQMLPYIVRLNNESGNGFVRDWQPPGFGRERHIGYAFQWFAMAAALMAIYLVVNTRRKSDHEQRNNDNENR